MNEVKAYEGNEPYIFISYSHDDNKKVLPIIAKLQEKYNVWFDDGIHFGDDYKRTIVKHINDCSLFVYMVSLNSLRSDFCQKEIMQAERKNRPFINVIIENCLDSEEAEMFLFDYEKYQMCLLYKMSLDEFIKDIERKAPEIKKAQKEAIPVVSIKQKEARIEVNKDKNTTQVITPTVVSDNKKAEPKNEKKLIFPLSDNLLDEYESTTYSTEDSINYSSNVINEIDKSFYILNIKGHVSNYFVGAYYTSYLIELNEQYTQYKLGRASEVLGDRLSERRIRIVNQVADYKIPAFEIPNKKMIEVPFKKVYKSLPSVNKNPLVVPLGEDVLGKTNYWQLSELKNIFVTGTLGSGKNTVINTMLISLMMRYSPDDLRFIIFDSTSADYAFLRNSSHLYCPFIAGKKAAYPSLEILQSIISDRLAKFKNLSIEEYNSVSDKKEIPLVVLFNDIDLLFDKNDVFLNLFLSVMKDAYKSGIYFIVSMKTDKLDECLKRYKQKSFIDSFNTVIALYMNKAEESKAVIDVHDACLLLGKGDMLVRIAKNDLVRLVAPFIKSSEVRGVIKKIGEYYPVSYLNELDSKGADPLYQWVIQREYVTLTLVMMSFKVNEYNAQKMIKRMIDNGYIDSAITSKGYKVIVKK